MVTVTNDNSCSNGVIGNDTDCVDGGKLSRLMLPEVGMLVDFVLVYTLALVVRSEAVQHVFPSDLENGR